MRYLHIAQGMKDNEIRQANLKKLGVVSLLIGIRKVFKNVFMHDSVSCYKIRSITAFLAQNQVSVLP